MIKSRAGEAGEGVDNSYNAVVIIQNDERVNRVMIHRLTGINYLGVLVDRLRFARHDVRNRRTEE